MGQEFIISIAQEAIFTVLLVAAPVLCFAMITGLTISIIQTTTSIQEQTLTFVPKIVAIMSTVLVFGPWMLRKLMDLSIRLIRLLPQLSP